MKAEIRVMLLQAKEPPEVAGKPPETKKGPGTDLSLPARMESTHLHLDPGLLAYRPVRQYICL